MYQITTVTAPASEPITTAELKAWLRLNTTAEDTILSGCITSARMLFEHHTQRALITQTLRQYVSRIDEGITIARGPVASLSFVKYYDPDGNLVTSSSHASDLISSPARVWWLSPPSVSLTIPKPAYVEFVAGYGIASAVPQDIKQCLLLTASHYYENREAYTPDTLKELPMGFCAVVAKYELGLMGDLHQ